MKTSRDGARGLTRNSPAPQARGITLVEVLIALAVIGVGLIAALKAVEQVGRDSHSARARLLASMSAENMLIETKFDAKALAADQFSASCPQAGLMLTCSREIGPTAHPKFRKVSVEVRDEAGRLLAQRAAFIGTDF